MFSIYVIIFLIFLITFVDKFEGFYTLLGLAGAGVTFALREIIVSIAGWFAIVFGNYYLGFGNWQNRAIVIFKISTKGHFCTLDQTKRINSVLHCRRMEHYPGLREKLG